MQVDQQKISMATLGLLMLDRFLTEEGGGIVTNTLIVGYHNYRLAERCQKTNSLVLLFVFFALLYVQLMQVLRSV